MIFSTNFRIFGLHTGEAVRSIAGIGECSGHLRVSRSGRYALATAVTAAAALLSACGEHAGSDTVPAFGGTGNRLTHHRTFTYTGHSESFKVPANLAVITVVARGGGSPEGRGGRVHAVIPVTGGETLVVFVGGIASGRGGAFNGGARGGLGYYCCSGYGGSGASDVRINGKKLSDRVVVAGGGGGEGGQLRGFYGLGGKGGGRIGGSGGSANGSSSASHCGGEGGGGGSQSVGGQGGVGGACYTSDGIPGAVGRLGAGGKGGGGAYYFDNGGGGGGGGGGYFGGGGGGGGSFNYSYGFGGGGGGGGGSSYVEPSAIDVQSWRGWEYATGNGEIVFYW